jgi:hypothetical protein
MICKQWIRTSTAQNMKVDGWQLTVDGQAGAFSMKVDG